MDNIICDCAFPAILGNTKCCENCLNNPNYGQKTVDNKMPNLIVKEEKKKMELFETADLMKSLDYKERFIAEYVQLKIRHDKLCDIIVKYEANRLPFEPKCSLDLLNRQVNAMEEYLHCLRVRAILEDIELPEV